jgi:hypothetical protein
LVHIITGVTNLHMCINGHVCDECILTLCKVTRAQAGFMFVLLLPLPIFGAKFHMTEPHEFVVHKSESLFVV